MTRHTQSKLPRKDLLRLGRFYVVRVLFSSLVLAMLVVNDMHCQGQPLAHVWLLLAGVAYPHLGHLLFGRLEGRRRRGHAILVLDGLFSGAVIAAIGPVSPASAVLTAINVFNWMTIGGPVLLILGSIAALGGFVLSGETTTFAQPEACMASNITAAIVLIAYFFVIARVLHRHMAELRQQLADLQSESDAATNARKIADRALLAVLPSSAAGILGEQGQLPPATLDNATVLLVEFVWSEPDTPSSVSELAECMQTCEAILNRHGFEGIKTFGRHYLAMSQAKTGPDDAIAAIYELDTHLYDHSTLTGCSGEPPKIRAFLHFGSVTTGLIQPHRLNFDLLGETIETLHAIADQAPKAPLSSITASMAAHSGLKTTTGFTEMDGRPKRFVYPLPKTPAP